MPGVKNKDGRIVITNQYILWFYILKIQYISDMMFFNRSLIYLLTIFDKLPQGRLYILDVKSNNGRRNIWRKLMLQLQMITKEC